jgi:hypothetical protein
VVIIDWSRIIGVTSGSLRELEEPEEGGKGDWGMFVERDR